MFQPSANQSSNSNPFLSSWSPNLPDYTPSLLTDNSKLFSQSQASYNPYVSMSQPRVVQNIEVVPRELLEEQLRKNDSEINLLKAENLSLQGKLNAAHDEIARLKRQSMLAASHRPFPNSPLKTSHPSENQRDPIISTNPPKSGLAELTSIGTSQNSASPGLTNQLCSSHTPVCLNSYMQEQREWSQKQQQLDAILAKALHQEEQIEQDSEIARMMEMEEGFENWPLQSPQFRNIQQPFPNRARANSEDEYQAMLDLQEDLGSVHVGLSEKQIQSLCFTVIPRKSSHGPFTK
jgi:hypothetical protein